MNSPKCSPKSSPKVSRRQTPLSPLQQRKTLNTPLSPLQQRKTLNTPLSPVQQRKTLNKLFRYEIQNENFASGCFGTILLANDPIHKRQVVIKKIPKDGQSTMEVAHEVEAGKTLKHSNVVTFHEHFSNNEWDFLVFERIHGSDLFSIIDKRRFVPFSDEEAKNIFKQILKAMRYSHSQNIVHRDLKLENILMDAAGKVTVIDFGLCDLVKDGRPSERFCGSIDYVAPEVLGKKSYDGFLADSFSLGVVLYTLLFAEFPFVAKERLQSLRLGKEHAKIVFSETKMKRWNIEPLAKDLISKMLRSNPEKRISLNEVKLHPWLRRK